MSTAFAITTKNQMGHVYTESGKRLAVTRLGLKVAKIVDSGEKLATVAYQTSKHINKPQKVELEAKNISLTLNKKVSFPIDSKEGTEMGQDLSFSLFSPGDVISVQGKTKGKGFAGVVKRWGFAGGPKTHGQSDRHRAPGAISSGQTLGRVRKGQKMAGRLGGKTQTIKNLIVMGFDKNTNEMLVSGSVPGPYKGILFIKKIGQQKNFEPIANYSNLEESSNHDIESKNEIVNEQNENNE